MLNALIHNAARQAHEAGHKLNRFTTYHDGAVSTCKLCSCSVRVTTIKGGHIVGKALDACSAKGMGVMV